MEEEKENATTDSQPTTLEEKSDVDEGLLFFDFVYALRYFDY